MMSPSDVHHALAQAGLVVILGPHTNARATCRKMDIHAHTLGQYARIQCRSNRDTERHGRRTMIQGSQL